VRLALVFGRPLSFKMDLYQPLYLPRPTVQPRSSPACSPPPRNAIDGLDEGRDACSNGTGARQELNTLMRQFNARIKEGRADEALALAYRMKEIDPDNVAADAAITNGQAPPQHPVQ